MTMIPTINDFAVSVAAAGSSFFKLNGITFVSGPDGTPEIQCTSRFAELDARWHGTPCRIFTTCGEDKTVESVSVWIVGGEREVTETEADEWEARITDFVGAGPAGDEEISEGGNKNLRWTKDGTAITLHQMKDILTVSLQPAVGELK